LQVLVQHLRQVVQVEVLVVAQPLEDIMDPVEVVVELHHLVL
jgi:hypothetical protein